MIKKPRFSSAELGSGEAPWDTFYIIVLLSCAVELALFLPWFALVLSDVLRFAVKMDGFRFYWNSFTFTGGRGLQRGRSHLCYCFDETLGGIVDL